MQGKKYSTFVLMLFCSAITMYITMYFNTYTLGHVFFSWTRLYMTLIGVGAMSIIMFLFMQQMYKNKIKNIALLVCSFLVMILGTFLVRFQIPIDDIKWMKAMIPHHSIAILTSSNANIQDPEVKELANAILATQKKEIKQMKTMIKRLENNKH